MYDLIRANKRRSVLLIIAFVALVALIGFAFGVVFGNGITATIVALVIGAVVAFASYWKADKIALAVSRAHPADPQEYARLHNIVEGLCIAGGLPKPGVYVIDDPAPNAFATGRDPNHAAIAVTTGLLEKMNRVELEGVVAHELSHIRNYDILVMTLTVTMVGIIALLSDFFLRWMWFGNRRDNDSNNPLGVIFMLIGFVLLMFAPIIAYIMQHAVSRRREYLADASGAQLTRYPPGLISALEKLKADETSIHSASKATAHLWIEQPLDRESKRNSSKLNHLFDTHPPLDDRIRALQAM
jgi:heat shock protein HtpX